MFKRWPLSGQPSLDTPPVEEKGPLSSVTKASPARSPEAKPAEVCCFRPDLPASDSSLPQTSWPFSPPSSSCRHPILVASMGVDFSPRGPLSWFPESLPSACICLTFGAISYLVTFGVLMGVGHAQLCFLFFPFSCVLCAVDSGCDSVTDTETEDEKVLPYSKQQSLPPPETPPGNLMVVQPERIRCGVGTSGAGG